jgi:hypothetical protein
LKLSKRQLLVIFLLLLGLSGCRSTSNKRAQALFDEATKISDQEIKIMNQWAREFGQVFSEQNRAQFPGNRDWLNSRAQTILPRIDESLRLSNEALDKYEEGGRLLSNEQQRKGWALITASFRKSIEIEELLKAQAQLASDQTITDAKAFNEKFAHITAVIKQKQKEKDVQFDEGRRLVLKQ